jgi:hypothetical protein
MTRAVGSLAVLAALAALLTFAPAAAAKSCRVGDEGSYGTTYVLKIKASNTSCRSARRVIRAFHACRPGKKGRCDSRVRGYSCSENRGNRGVTSYDSTVTCRNGGKTVKHKYTQWI